MKKTGYVLIIFFVIGLIILAAVANDNGGGDKAACDFIRIHIRANSNTREDQAVKYAVKEDVVAYLTPLVAGCNSRADVVRAINGNLAGISAAATRKLEAAGFCYGARAEFKEEYFPARDYDGLTLASGVYDALILRLGDGAGDNWWCVVYPPLCFADTEYTDGQGVKYKSKIAELIEQYFG